MNIISILLGISVIFPIFTPGNQNAEHGFLSQYDQAPTDGTIAYRQSVMELPKDISQFDGLIAVADCDKMGDSAWLSIEDIDEPLHVVVFDCSGHASTTEWMQEDNIIAEVSYYLARDYGFLDKGGVEASIYWME